MKTPLVLTESTTVDDVVRGLDANGIGFLAVVDAENKLLGIVTDGDLRKALLRGEYNLENLINRNPTTVNDKVPYVMVKRQLREIHRQHMPVVSDTGELVDIVVLTEFSTPTKDNWVVIMAGGLGSRLGELTKETPKPMLEIEGRPMLHHIMDNFSDMGFRKFYLCVNYKSHIIEDYFKDGSHLGYEVKYTHETKRLGTAGALSLIEQEMQHPFFVINGDVITNVDFSDMMNYHITSGSKATMCIKSFSQEVPFACVEFSEDGDLQRLREKPSYEHFVNAGIYILNGELLPQIPKDIFYDMPTFFEQQVENGEVVKIFRMDDYWLDVGRPDDYKRVKQDFAG